MPFDGIVVKNIVEELSSLLEGGRIEKIYQPEADEVILNIRSKGQNLKLILSANASYPRIHITSITKENPQVPPMFCMLLRKHISGGKILGFDFHDFERIVSIYIESISELGDLTTKKLIIEIMGKHSNIILLNNEDKIIDSIKHVDSDISRVREVMPARPYVLPPSQDKTSPMAINKDSLKGKITENPDMKISKILLNNIKGFSPLLCEEICYRAEIEEKTPAQLLTFTQIELLLLKLEEIISEIRNSAFTPCIIWSDLKNKKPKDFHSLKIIKHPEIEIMSSISEVLDTFYSSKDTAERLSQKKADMTKNLNNSIDRCNKKISIHEETLRSVADREKYKLYGELITANIYCIPKNTNTVSLLNYYSENSQYIDIPLNENKLPQENAQIYFKKYSKAKNAYTYTKSQLEDTFKELQYLESVMHNLETASQITEIEAIRQELASEGYMTLKKKPGKKKEEKGFAPLLYMSSDNLEIYVGRNNVQNDMLTLKLSSSNDIWFHTKNIPGSHVVVKKHQNEIPQRTLLEAAMLAAYHSKGKLSSHVEVDYTQIKYVKKPGGAKPGMVIYSNHKTIVVTPDEEVIDKLKPKK